MNVKKEIKRKRFLKLIRKFRELPEERLDLKVWVTKDPGSGGISPKFLLEHPCGTAGCLAGWTVAWFPRHWRYSEWGSVPHLKPSLEIYGCSPAVNMAEYFGGWASDWEKIMYPGYYPVEEESARVPKHLVMKRLTNLYNKIYRKKMKAKESTKRKRFLKLIKKFRELPDERFYLENWITCNSEYSKVTSAKFLLEHPCGTAGCLAGWTVAWFPRHWKYSDLGRIPQLKKTRTNIAPNFCMSEYFGGTYDDWAHVIYPRSYPVEQRGIGGVPKHLVMERLLELYNRLYKFAHKKKRFQRLIKKLSELPDERFDLRSWVNTGCPDDYQKPIPSNFLIKNKRGTTGSVGGWVVAWWPKHWHYVFGQPRLNTSDANSYPESDLSEFFGGDHSEWLEIISIWGYRSNPSKKEVLKKVIALYEKLYP